MLFCNDGTCGAAPAATTIRSAQVAGSGQVARWCGRKKAARRAGGGARGGRWKKTSLNVCSKKADGEAVHHSRREHALATHPRQCWREVCASGKGGAAGLVRGGGRRAIVGVCLGNLLRFIWPSRSASFAKLARRTLPRKWPVPAACARVSRHTQTTSSTQAVYIEPRTACATVWCI